jgi:hypothetical protein
MTMLWLAWQGRDLREAHKNTNHLDWQGESSELAGQSKNLNDKM